MQISFLEVIERKQLQYHQLQSNQLHLFLRLFLNFNKNRLRYRFVREKDKKIIKVKGGERKKKLS